MPDICFLCQLHFDARKSKETQVMTGKGKTILDSKQDSQGNISAVLLKGNSTFTPIDTAINMTKRGQIDAVHVKETVHAKEHIRSRPDSKIGNNLDEMAKD